MGKTSIEWTSGPDGTPGKTWNPIRGCSRVSEGCRNCYAEAFAARFSDPEVLIDGETGGPPRDGRSKELVAPAGHWHGYAKRTPDGPRWTGRVELIPEKLTEPLSWRKPSRVFVNSMSDLFHEKLSNEEIAAVFGVMAAAPRHTFQILTKRPERASAFFTWLRGGPSAVTHCEIRTVTLATARVLRESFAKYAGPGARAEVPWPLPNVWLGVSVEDQATADARIPLLLQTPAAVRFVSYEPAIGPVNFDPFLLDPRWQGAPDILRPVNTLDWVIVGGESGPNARPFNVEWALSVVHKGRAAGVPVFVKQLGARPVVEEGSRLAKDWPLLGATGRLDDTGQLHLRDRKGGDPSEWSLDLRVREFPCVSGRVA